jgi:serine/threonine-protein kinase
MPIASLSALVRELSQYPLLEPGRLDELTNSLQRQFPEPRDLCRELIKRDWLTAYQVNYLLQGRAAELKLGSYVLIERLGEAPIGELFKARHSIMRRLVALQIVRQALLVKPEAVERFYQEVQTVARLSHRHLVAAYDAGPVGKTHFFAMEYVEGVDLQETVEKSGALPAAQACRFICQAALGLQHALERGLLHHDLRPANLLLGKSASGSGTQLIKVCNLGLTLLHQDSEASLAGSRPEDQKPELFDYVAPEQCTVPPRGMDVRSTLYSLGCTFHFLLTGQPPFPGGTAAEKIWRHLHEPPAPVDALCFGVTPSVTALVQRLMAKDPAARLQAPAEVAAALAALPDVGDGSWESESGIIAPRLLPAVAAPPPGQTAQPDWKQRWQQVAPRRRRQIIAGAAALLFSVALGIFCLARLPSSTVDSAAGRGSSLPAPPPKPLPPTLIVQCGKTDGGGERQRVDPGYDFRLVQGSHYTGWNHPLRTHCWHDAVELRFHIVLPPGTPGTLRLFCLDADAAGRKQKIMVAGKLVAEIEKFNNDGKLIEATLSAEQTRDGKIEVSIQNLGSTNAVISTVEFQPSAKR